MKDRLDKALDYHRIFAPLLAPGLESAEKRVLRERILVAEQIRTDAPEADGEIP